MYKKQIHSHINNINFAIKWFVRQAKTTLSYTCYISTSILWSPNRHPQCILYFFFSFHKPDDDYINDPFLLTFRSWHDICFTNASTHVFPMIWYILMLIYMDFFLLIYTATQKCAHFFLDASLFSWKHPPSI